MQDILANRFGLNFEAVLLPSEKFNENWMCFKTEMKHSTRLNALPCVTYFSNLVFKGIASIRQSFHVINI